MIVTYHAKYRVALGDKKRSFQASRGYGEVFEQLASDLLKADRACVWTITCHAFDISLRRTVVQKQ